MPRAKSFLPRLLIDQAGASHDCQHNPGHRIVKGTSRLKVIEGRSVEHFCIECAIEAIKADILKLKMLLSDLEDSRA